MQYKTIGESVRFPKLNQYAGLEGNIPLRYGDIFMGIEIEAENISRNRIQFPGSFNMVEDGSLKLDGKEFVTVPIKLMYLEKELERLFSAIPNATFSSRTSIHVHMNARDFTVQNMLDFTMLYTLFERNLYRYSGNRWYNNFCIPLRTSPRFLRELLQYIHISGEERDQRVLTSNVGWSKYLGYNLGPLTGNREGSNGYGTIEFRHMAGNNNIPYIIDWCNLITCMKFYIKAMDSEVFHKLIEQNQAHTIVEDVFRKWTPLIIPDKDLSSIQDANTFLKYCIEFSKKYINRPETVQVNPDNMQRPHPAHQMGWSDFAVAYDNLGRPPEVPSIQPYEDWQAAQTARHIPPPEVVQDYINRALGRLDTSTIVRNPRPVLDHTQSLREILDTEHQNHPGRIGSYIIDELPNP